MAEASALHLRPRKWDTGRVPSDEALQGSRHAKQLPGTTGVVVPWELCSTQSVSEKDTARERMDDAPQGSQRVKQLPRTTGVVVPWDWT
ncbi:hypothetical protein NDU88_005760 [Pleurodeles waltl]|uniref:Uncharacterized protein n=1 Tax=Pleurodeles waltl TaxID=8319 RepID=A0AAV7MC78_PLEWA|nr:hypothetical protein NDU88_005760 [Pleurodeles waltl]